MTSSYYCPADTPDSNYATFSVQYTDEEGFEKTSTTRLTLDGAVAKYSSSTGTFQFHPNAIQCPSEETWERLISDCELLFPLDRSFWIQQGSHPRCALEALACSIYNYHTRNLPPLQIDEDKSLHGIEWWVQIRRGEDGHSTHSPVQRRRSPRVIARDPEDVNLHWDKDETLIDEGGPIIHPLISTVSYLSSQGAPTLIIPISAHDGLASDHVYISYPCRGKHISFDGRWLHSAPRFLARDAPLDYLRVTLLVNIWKGYKPIGVDQLPLSITTNLLGPLAAPRLSFQSRRGARVPVVYESILNKSLGATTCMCLRFGATKRGEWELTLPIPRRPIDICECPCDTMRFEFSLKRHEFARLTRSTIV
jgi:hypothetical protein